jgi:hypothetical protein
MKCAYPVILKLFYTYLYGGHKRRIRKVNTWARIKQPYDMEYFAFSLLTKEDVDDLQEYVKPAVSPNP